MTPLTAKMRGVSERTHAVGRRGLAAMMLSLVAVLSVINAIAFVVMGSRDVSLSQYLIRSKWNLLAGTEDVDWLVVGDSSCNQGFRGDVLERDGGGSSMNLCTTGNWQTLDDSWMLAEYLAAHPAPRVVLVIHTYDAWWRRPTAGAQMPSLIPRPGVIDRMARSFPHRLSLYREAYLPLWSRNRSLREILVRGGDTPTHPPLDAYGYMAHGRGSEKAVRRDVETHRRFLHAQPTFEISDSAKEPLLEMVALATEHGFDLVLADGPIAAPLAEDPAWRHYREQIDATLTSIARQSPRVHRVSRVFSFPVDALVSADHLAHPHAQSYTTQVIDSVREVLR